MSCLQKCVSAICYGTSTFMCSIPSGAWAALKNPVAVQESHHANCCISNRRQQQAKHSRTSQPSTGRSAQGLGYICGVFGACHRWRQSFTAGSSLQHVHVMKILCLKCCTWETIEHLVGLVRIIPRVHSFELAANLEASSSQSVHSTRSIPEELMPCPGNLLSCWPIVPLVSIYSRLDAGTMPDWPFTAFGDRELVWLLASAVPLISSQL